MLPQRNEIENNIELIKEFLDDVIVAPRNTLHKWATITNQTPAVKLGYIGQHLASLITGVKGTGSGARGDDLSDGSEVKSCNKIDQADKCLNCGSRVLRFEEVCPQCGSTDIKRKNDSKWLFSIRDEYELEQYLTMDRIVLILMDYPNFLKNDFKDIRISCFEIYPKEERMSVFCELIRNYYYHIFRPKLEANEKTNPMNLHPFGFQFYKCNPIQIFSCIIKNIETNPEIEIDEDKYIPPYQERDANIPSLMMPSSLLRANEWEILLERADYEREIKHLLVEKTIQKEKFMILSIAKKIELLPFLDEVLRSYIPLREIVSIQQRRHYRRS